MSVLKWLNTAAFAAMVAVNALANLLPIGGNTTGQISEAYPNLFTPAPITFSIWVVIYLLLAIFIVYQWGVFDKDQYSTRVREQIGLWFVISCILNILWILLWHNRLISLSAICIGLMLLTLIVIQWRLEDVGGSFLLRMSAKSGFSLYLGWIIAATVANFFVLLTETNRPGWGTSSDFLTVVVMLLCMVITSGIILIYRNQIIGIAVMWAYAGILIRHLSPLYYNGQHPFVIAAGFLSEAILLAVLLMSLMKKDIKEPNKQSA